MLQNDAKLRLGAACLWSGLLCFALYFVFMMKKHQTENEQS